MLAEGMGTGDIDGDVDAAFVHGSELSLTLITAVVFHCPCSLSLFSYLGSAYNIRSPDTKSLIHSTGKRRG